jgi:hypothetical protein
MAASESKSPTETPAAPAATPRPYQEAAAQVRVRPLYDPVEVARKYLDEMEREGRLHHRQASRR